MKILVVCDNYSKGGLETQINTYYNNLSLGNKMIFAFGNYTKTDLLKNANIYDGFHFSYNDTINDFCNDVERLVEIIQKEKIDVIHVHPYYGYFAALFASQITKVKMVYSYHGIGSYNFAKTNISQPIFLYAFECGAVAKVLSVSKIGVDCFKNFEYENALLLENPIDFKKFPVIKYIKNNKWLLVSRIDSDKINEIKLIISKMNDYDIEQIDIIGDGSEFDNLNRFITDNKLNDKIYLKGYSDNIYEEANGGYNGIIGIGRVVLESLAMKMPCILIGNNKITGYVNKKIYDEVKDINFINRTINDINNKMINDMEIDQIYLDIKNNFSINVVIKKYLDILKNSESIYMNNLVELYKGICELNKNTDLQKCYFHKERFVYNLVEKYINKFSVKNAINNIFVNANLVYELYDLTAYRMNEEKENKND